MNGTIARIRNFELRRKSFLCEHTYTTHEIEIVRWDRYGNISLAVPSYQEEYCFTIANFNEEGEIVSCGDRLLTYFAEDVEAIVKLAKIAQAILDTPEVEIGTWKPEIKLRD